MRIGLGTRLTKLAAGLRAALSLDFLSGRIDPRITFTRGTGGGYFGSDGLYKWQGYNLLTASNAFIANGGTPTQGASDPFGGSAAWTVTEQIASGGQGAYVTSATTTAATHTASMYVKAGTGNICQMLVPALMSSAYINCTLSGAGTVNQSASTLSNGIEALANGWYRIWMTFTAAATSGGLYLSHIPNTTNGRSPSYLGTGKTILAYGGQIEAGSTATQYSPTTTAANSAPRLNYDPATPAGATGVELVTNGDFSNGLTGWTTISGGWSASSGTAVLAGNGSPQDLSQVVSVTAGKTYLASYSILSASGGSLVLNIDGVTVASGSSGVLSGYFRATASTATFVAKRFSGTVNAVIDNISVQEVTFAPRGLLVEEQRTNNELNGSAYTKGVAGDTVAQNAVAPDGTTTAYTITGDGTSGNHNTQQASVTPTATNTYTISVFLKAGTQSLVQVTTASAHGGATIYCNYNLSTSAPAMTAGAGIVSGSNFQTYVGGGWYRCGFSYVASATAAGAAVVTAPVSTISDTRLQANSLATSYLRWGGQYESTNGMGSATFVTSYIPTTTASATRSADSALMTGTNFSSWYNQTQGTFVVEYFREPSQTSYTVQGVSVSDGTLNNRLQQQLTGNGYAANVYRSGGVNNDTAATTTGITALGANGKVASAYDSSGSAVVTNGSAVVTGGGSLPVSPNILYISANSTGTVTGVNHIRRIQYYPTRLPNATLQTLTA